MRTSKNFLFSKSIAYEVAEKLNYNVDYKEDVQFMIESAKQHTQSTSLSDREYLVEYLNKNPKECGEWMFWFDGEEYSDIEIEKLSENFFLFHFINYEDTKTL